MSARSYSRGHPVEVEANWIYSDTKQPVNENRPCVRCKRPPTAEGHDACLGRLWGVSAACCGHGVTEPHVKRAYMREVLRLLVRFWIAL